MEFKRFLCIILIVLMLFLLGCDKDDSKGSASVQSREYIGGVAGMDYSGWTNDVVKLKNNVTLFRNTEYGLTAVCTAVNDKELKVKFSYPVYCETIDMNNDVFTLEKARTYEFATGSMSGVEVKIRYR